MHNRPLLNSRTLAAAFVALALLSAATAYAAPRSALSKWFSSTAVPEIRRLLQEHPRYRDQRVAIVSKESDALSEGLVKVLSINLRGRPGIQLIEAGTVPANANTIDALHCAAAETADYLLEVSASPYGYNKAQVSLALVAAAEGEIKQDDWYWNGRLNRAEREYLGRDADTRHRDGSLAAPWTSEDVEQAAAALSRQLACALRPQVQTHLALEWPEAEMIPAVFADTVNHSRHLLGGYRELALDGEGADYSVALQLTQFREGIWQLWLTGTPAREGGAPVQAVTYLAASNPVWPTQAVAVNPRESLPLPEEDALEFIEVEMLDAVQQKARRNRARLEVRLRITNRADWPMEYAFSLSGGHFNYCIAEPEYYRHDAWGKLKGQLDGGKSVVRTMVIEKARHQPTLVFGTPHCAGFLDLEGFEYFADRGYKVTDYVRWQTSEEAWR